jgi:hypothetical protein
MRNSINTLLIIDIGVIIFCLLSGNRIWLINSQIGFVTSSLVMIASIISYRNMVKDRLDLGIVVSVDNRDTIEKIEDPYDLYNKNKPMREIVQEEKRNLKKNRRSIWQITKDSKASLSFYRLGAYSLLILGFFYLNNSHKLDITSYLFSLSLPPIIVIITLIRKIR